MHILHVLAPAPFGGLESVVLGLATGQVQAGLTVSVAAVVEDPSRHPFVSALSDSGATVHSIRARGRRYLRERRNFSRVIETTSPDVVHSHGYRTDLVDVPLARARGIPNVTTLHGFTGGGVRNRVYEWLQRRSLRRFSATIAVSKKLAADVAPWVPPHRLHVIPNARRAGSKMESRDEARRLLDVSPDARVVIGFVGRIGHEKGPDVLIEAARELPPDFEIHMIGAGRLQPQLEARAMASPGGAGIVWHGRVAEAARLMPGFDVLVLPSRTEGTPMVLFEATEAGVPVVASAVGGVPDVLGDGPNVIKAGDPHLLAHALVLLGRDEGQRRTAIQRARCTVERRYSFDAWISAHEVLYGKLNAAAESG